MRSTMLLLLVLAAFSTYPEAKSQTSQASDNGMVITTSTVVTKSGDVVISPVLIKENFRVFDCKDAKKRKDCVEQDIVFFSSPKEEEPLTAVLVLDYSQNAFYISCLGEQDPYACGYYGANGAIQDGPMAFLQNLRKNDWVALVTYNALPEILVEFTKNKDEVASALGELFALPPSRYDSNLFDALFYVLDHIGSGENLGTQKRRTAVILISTGLDTMSRKKLNDMEKRLKDTTVAIYPVRIGKSYQNRYGGQMGSISQMTLLQAEQQLKQIAALTGGKVYSPAFAGEFRGIFDDISAMLRFQYSIGFVPKNVKLDGKFHELRIEVMGDFMDNATQKPLALEVRHRKGYMAPDNR